MYADVIVDISHESVDRPFEYIIPPALEGFVRQGSRVNVPFGRSDKLKSGYVTAIREKPVFEEARLKAIDSVVEKSVTIEGTFIELAIYIRENFGGTLNQALKTVLPVKKSSRPIETKYICLKPPAPETAGLIEKYSKDRRSGAKVRLLSELMHERVLPYSIIRDKLNISVSTLKALERDGIIEIDVREKLRDALRIKEKQEYNITLDPTQQVIADDIWERYRGGDSKPSLIHGVTGSGKTEIYIDLIDRFIKEGRQAIVLIPEIALTYQTVLRFYKKFGERISVLNSRMTAAERYDQVEKARKGDIDIIIGPRSALFTPFRDPGIIIIDEEHEGTYKNENIPRYHAREVAVKRAQMSGGIVVMGSATPSMDSFNRAQNGEFVLYSLKKRAGGASLPDVEVVDLREELAGGNRSMISTRLKELILDRLEKKEQIMLFINRRGHSSFVSCRSCGTAIQCPHCDVSLKYHNVKGGRLVCHYCGYEIPMMKKCPSCGSPYIGTFGTGTQKVQEEIGRLFPEAKTLRMDFDTTREKDGHEKILNAFTNREADILIGTQMIVKGHDFANVTLVGIVAADLSLYTGDYQASERTFQLLTQAAGRAGRGAKKGNVVIQTYSPDNYAVRLGAAQDFRGFYDFEMEYRRLLGYPPAMRMLEILFTGPDSSSLGRRVDEIGYIIERQIGEKGMDVQKIGPTNAPVARINDRYRKMIYIKTGKYGDLTEIKDLVENYMNMHPERDVLATFDFR